LFEKKGISAAEQWLQKRIGSNKELKGRAAYLARHTGGASKLRRNGKKKDAKLLSRVKRESKGKGASGYDPETALKPGMQALPTPRTPNIYTQQTYLMRLIMELAHHSKQLIRLRSRGLS
jgi:hypothetical protein